MRLPMKPPRRAHARARESLPEQRDGEHGPVPIDEARIESELREIFAQAQRDLDAGKGRDVSLDALRRDFERDALASRPPPAARQAPPRRS
jgi:hypothetical protein